MKKLTLNLIKTILFSMMLFGFSMPILADDLDDSSRDNPSIYHVYEDVNLVSTQKYQYGRNPRFTAKSVYPQLESSVEADGINHFNQFVIDIVQQEVNAFKNQLIQREANQQQPLPGKNQLFIDYDTSVIQPNHHHIISIRFIIQGFVAGFAHPYHYHRVLNYDVENSQKIELSDLFKPGANYLDVLSNYTRGVLLKRLKNSPMVSEGTAPKPANFANWNIKPNGLLITFDEAQVAPYVNGAQTVLVPYSVLKSIASPESPLAGCIKNKKKCGRNNLLTGGFIDEAVNTRHRTLNPILGKV